MISITVKKKRIIAVQYRKLYLIIGSINLKLKVNINEDFINIFVYTYIMIKDLSNMIIMII